MRTTTYTCDECGKTLVPGSEDWGNCGKCGDDLCLDCGGDFDDGLCARCSLAEEAEQ